MTRISIPKDTEAEVLFKAQHLCSICQKSELGIQTHHIDGNSSNNKEENLIVLCMHHHDKASSKSTISKSYTQKELIKYKRHWEDIVKKRREALEVPENIRLIRFDGKDIDTVFLESEPGKLRGFQDPYTFVFMDFNWGNVDIYRDSDRHKFDFDEPLGRIKDCKKIRVKYSNGSLANEIFLIWEDGRKHHILDTDTLSFLGGEKNVEIIDSLEFNTIPRGQAIESVMRFRIHELLQLISDAPMKLH